jgi:hypothetical protein
MSYYNVVEDGIEYRIQYEGVNSVWISTRYYFEGSLHRLGGPAVEYNNGPKEWWIKGKKLDCSSQEEFLKIIKLKAFW